MDSDRWQILLKAGLESLHKLVLFVSVGVAVSNILVVAVAATRAPSCICIFLTVAYMD